MSTAAAEGEEDCTAEETGSTTSTAAGKMPHFRKELLPSGVTNWMKPPFLLTRRRWRRSTIRSKKSRKSAPRMGKAIFASRKRQLKQIPPACNRRSFHPQQGIGDASAVVIRGPEGGLAELKGMTEKTAPVSTRNLSPDASSTRRAKRPLPPGWAEAATATRLISFPLPTGNSWGCHSGRPLLHASSGSRK